MFSWPTLFRNLLSGIDSREPCFQMLLLNVSMPIVCSIFRSCLYSRYTVHRRQQKRYINRQLFINLWKHKHINNKTSASKSVFNSPYRDPNLSFGPYKTFLFNKYIIVFTWFQLKFTFI